MSVCTDFSFGQGTPAITSNEVFGMGGADSGILKYQITTTPHNVEPLYQDSPSIKSTFTRYTNRSLTDSLESFQNRAWKETVILRRNNRIPTKEFVLHFLKVFSAKVISGCRTKVFRVLTDNGLEAVASIELTKGIDGKPNNTVHFHLLTDDRRCERELRKLLETACERQGLLKDNDFSITYRELYDGYGYLDYLTKHRASDEVILFRKGTGLQKFCVIGKWFGKSKKQIWREYIRERYGSAPDGIDQSTNDIVVNGSQQLERELLPKEALTERENEMNETLDLHPFFEGQAVPDTVQQQVEPEYTIDLSKVLLSDRFRCRERENEETIERYAGLFTDFKEAEERGENPKYPFPAVWIWWDGNQYLLVTGFHRFEAAHRAGLDKIRVKVFEGTEKEAVWFAMQDNRKHGLRLSPGDLKYCIVKALRLFPDKTAGAIAKELGCGRSYAYRIESELSPRGQLTGNEKRRGADGKERSVKRKVKQSPATVLEQPDGNPKSNQQVVDTSATIPETSKPVISEPPHRRYLDTSQRAMLAHDEWERSREGNGKKKTLDQVAKEFAVSKALVQRAGIVKEIAPESLQQSVREGTVTITKAIDTATKAREGTGTIVLDDQIWRKDFLAMQSSLTHLERMTDRVLGFESKYAGQEDKRELLETMKDQFHKEAGNVHKMLMTNHTKPDQEQNRAQ